MGQAVLGFSVFFAERKRFLAKAVVVAVLVMAVGVVFFDRYRFGHDDQISKCLPGWNFMIIDRYHDEVQIGEVVAFSARGLEPLFDDGSTMVKVVRGRPGDEVSVFTDRVEVNGAVVGHGLYHAETLEVAPDRFVRSVVVQNGEYWVMGESNDSFDSRYWGTVKEEQIIGSAHRVY